MLFMPLSTYRASLSGTRAPQIKNASLKCKHVQTKQRYCYIILHFKVIVHLAVFLGINETIVAYFEFHSVLERKLVKIQ